MRIRRALTIPAILALGVAGSILAASEMPVTTAHAPSVHVQAETSSSGIGLYYHL